MDNGQRHGQDEEGDGENRVYVYGRLSGGEESGLVRLYTASSIEHERIEKRGREGDQDTERRREHATWMRRNGGDITESPR